MEVRGDCVLPPTHPKSPYLEPPNRPSWTSTLKAPPKHPPIAPTRIPPPPHHPRRACGQRLAGGVGVVGLQGQDVTPPPPTGLRSWCVVVIGRTATR